jgi:hypothetical protein
MSVPLPLSAQGNDDKADGLRLVAPLNLKPGNTLSLLSSIVRGAISASQENDEQVGVFPEWAAAPGRGYVRALGVRDDGQPTVVTS